MQLVNELNSFLVRTLELVVEAVDDDEGPPPSVGPLVLLLPPPPFFGAANAVYLQDLVFSMSFANSLFDCFIPLRIFAWAIRSAAGVLSYNF
jgi:hypothetical protein